MDFVGDKTDFKAENDWTDVSASSYQSKIEDGETSESDFDSDYEEEVAAAFLKSFLAENVTNDAKSNTGGNDLMVEDMQSKSGDIVKMEGENITLQEFVGTSGGNKSRRELRVVLKRLQFGIDGKIIAPEEYIIDNKFSNKAQLAVLLKHEHFDKCEDNWTNSLLSKTESPEVQEGYCILGSKSPKKEYPDEEILNENQCKLCRKQCKTKKAVQEHFRRCSAEKQFKCPSCGKAFITNAELAQHSTVHSSGKPFECPICKKGFSFKHNMVTHSRHHTRENLSYCPDCGKGFVTRSKMLNHHKNVHVGARIFDCPHCDKKFTDKFHVVKHVKGTHTRDWKHKCDKCGRAFRDFKKLSNHMRIHNEIMPFECKTCGRKFRTEEVMKSHIRTHTNDYQYRCGICGQGTLGPAPLLIHLKTHTGEKPLQCPVCKKRFLHKCQFNKHVRGHKQ